MDTLKAAGRKEAFYEYIANCFYSWLNVLPVDIFLDKHTSHLSLALSEFCILALLSNSTHPLQALDVAVFRPVKCAWRKIVNSR